MFRRKDEGDEEFSNTEAGGSQGSLLGGNYTEAERPATPASPIAGAGIGAAASSAFQMSAAQPRGLDAAPRPQPISGTSPLRPAVPAENIRRPAPPEAVKPQPLPPTLSQPIPSSSNKESRRVLTVGADILLKGEIATCDRLVIEGKVDAMLNDVGTVELAESGSFKGVAQVENAEISGLFEGELIVKGRLVIYASGKVRGKVTYGEIEIERGGELSGEIKTMASSGVPRSSNRKDDKVAA